MSLSDFRFVDNFVVVVVVDCVSWCSRSKQTVQFSKALGESLPVPKLLGFLLFTC